MRKKYRLKNLSICLLISVIQCVYWLWFVFNFMIQQCALAILLAVVLFLSVEKRAFVFRFMICVLIFPFIFNFNG